MFLWTLHLINLLIEDTQSCPLGIPSVPDLGVELLVRGDLKRWRRIFPFSRWQDTANKHPKAIIMSIPPILTLAFSQILVLKITHLSAKGLAKFLRILTSRIWMLPVKLFLERHQLTQEPRCADHKMLMNLWSPWRNGPTTISSD